MELRHSESIGKVIEALAKASSEFKPITKNTTNPYYQQKYADLSALIDATRPALAANGLVVLQTPRVIANRAVEITSMLARKRNFVERDPLPGTPKRLEVNYSYDGQSPRTIERREHGRLLLPEDSAIQWLRSEIDRIKAAQPKPSQYPLGGLRLKILELCVELKGFLGEHGQEPKVERQLPESQEDFMQRWRITVDPWRAKFLGDFRLKFGDSIPRLQDEIRVRAGIDDFGVNNLIIKAASDPNGNVKSVEGLTRRLWELAYAINA